MSQAFNLLLPNIKVSSVVAFLVLVLMDGWEFLARTDTVGTVI